MTFAFVFYKSHHIVQLISSQRHCCTWNACCLKLLVSDYKRGKLKEKRKGFYLCLWEHILTHAFSFLHMLLIRSNNNFNTFVHTCNWNSVSSSCVNIFQFCVAVVIIFQRGFLQPNPFVCKCCMVLLQSPRSVIDVSLHEQSISFTYMKQYSVGDQGVNIFHVLLFLC